MNVRFDPVRPPARRRSRRPPDKSISHRAAILGAMAAEPVRVRNYLDAADTHLDARRDARARRAGRAARRRAS